MKKTLIFIVVIVVTITILGIIKKDTAVEVPVLLTQENSTLTPILSFNWDFKEASTFNLDGQAQTEVYLLATYENNMSERKLIDTVDGSCSKLPGNYEGDISNTQKIQCYSAGLGQQYRITSEKNSYLVERKFFEEALPNSPSPDYDWEPLVELSLVK